MRESTNAFRRLSMAVLIFTPLAAPTNAIAEDPFFETHVGVQMNYIFSLPDMDGPDPGMEADGTPELAWIGNYGNGQIISGMTGENFYNIPNPGAQTQAYDGVDATGDGTADAVVSGSTPDGGSAVVYDGESGAIAFVIATEPPEPGEPYEYSFGEGLAVVGNLDEDDDATLEIDNPNRDIIIGSPGYDNNNGRVVIYNDNQDVLFELVGSGSFTRVGMRVYHLADANDDGISDFAVVGEDSAANRKVVKAFSGASIHEDTPEELWTLSLPFNMTFAHGGGTPDYGKEVGDMNGDDINDLAFGWPEHNNVRVYSGENGDLLYNYVGHGGEFGFAISGRHDLNDDGKADIAITAPGVATFGAIYVIAGGGEEVTEGDKIGAEPAVAQERLYVFVTDPCNEFDFSPTRRVALVNDLNDDGHSDIAVASYDCIWAFPGGTGADPVFIAGDVNHSGSVEISDVVALLHYGFGESNPPAVLESANVNGDTQIDISDAIYLLEYLFLDGPAPIVSETLVPWESISFNVEN